MRERVILPEQYGDEKDFEATIRPHLFNEFVGQHKNIENLKVFIQAARERGEPLDHVILYGPPGLGKTTLANIIAHEMKAELKVTSGPALVKGGDLAGILSDLSERDVLFIDEIHRMNRVVEEYLYSAMEDFMLDIVIESGPGARSIRLPVKPFALIGATTRWGMLTPPMRARFGIQCRLDHYDGKELAQIVSRSSTILKTTLDPEAGLEIGTRSRGTPRLANRYLRRARDFAQVDGNPSISLPVVKKTLDRLDVDKLGLDLVDKQILHTLIEKYNGGPVGLNTLAVAIGEEADTIEEVFEPFLIQSGLLKRTPRGREVTGLAYRHFGLKPAAAGSSQETLF